MKKIGLYITLLFCVSISTYGQKVLNFEDISNPTDVYACEDRLEAKVIFYCDLSLDLTFSSNYKDIVSLTVDSVGNEKKYEIVLPTQGKGTSYDGRIFTVYATGFDKKVFMNFVFSPKTVTEYKVTDPYAKLQNPYYKYVDAATDLFLQGNYSEAREQYTMAKQCPEYEGLYKDDIDSKLLAIDTIQYWTGQGADYMNQTKYKKAHECYVNVMQLNPEDKYIQKKIVECTQSYLKDCSVYFTMAEDLFENAEYNLAKGYYQKVVDMECSQKDEATAKLVLIKNKEDSRVNKNRFFTYEFQKDVPIGFSVGTCKKKKVGGYFSLHTNVDAFQSAKSDKNTDIMPEINVSFGFTRKIIDPVWIFVGPGYTGGGTYEEKIDDEGNSQTPLTEDGKIKYKLNWRNAISPEIGLIVKYWYFNLKYTFQYRFALSNAEQKMLGKTRHYIGIGVAW